MHHPIGGLGGGPSGSKMVTVETFLCDFWTHYEPISLLTCTVWPQYITRQTELSEVAYAIVSVVYYAKIQLLSTYFFADRRSGNF